MSDSDVLVDEVVWMSEIPVQSSSSGKARDLLVPRDGMELMVG